MLPYRVTESNGRANPLIRYRARRPRVLEEDKEKAMRKVAALWLLAGVVGLASSVAEARVDVGIGIGIPGPAVVVPPPVYYEPPPPVYYERSYNRRPTAGCSDTRLWLLLR